MIKFYDGRIKQYGGYVEKLENEFAKYTGFKYGLAVNSCTSALFLCLEWERMKYGPKTITIPDRTFVSVANEIIHTGHEVKLDPNYFAVGRAYLLVGTHVIDSAHEVRKDVQHEREDKYCYSFYPTKLVPSYEGGMVCTDDEDFVQWAYYARQMGRTGYGAYYNVVSQGWKMNMTGLQAKEALKSLKQLPGWIKKSQKIRDRYNRYLKKWVVVDTPHIYSIRVSDDRYIYSKLKNAGIECSVHFEPISSKGVYGFKLQQGPSPLSLPLHQKLMYFQQMKVIKEVLKWLK